MHSQRKAQKRTEKTLSLHFGLIFGKNTAYNNLKSETINKNNNKTHQTLGKEGRNLISRINT